VTITVSNAGSSPAYIFTPGDIIMNTRTGERMLVATVASSTTITVASAGRAFGSTAAAAGLDSDKLFIIGNANEQFGFGRNVNSTKSSKVENLTQIFKKSLGASGTAMETKLYGGPELAHQNKKKAIEFQREVERMMHFGEKKATTGTQGHPLYAMGGIQEHIESQGAYVQNANGSPITRPDLEVFIREGFSYGSGRKLLECGGRVLSAISEIAAGQLQTVSGDDTYGVAIRRWVSPHGELDIVHNPLLVDEWAGYAFLLDMDSYRYVHMANRDVKLRTNIQAPDADGRVDELMGELSLERKGAAQNALLKGCA
jgi:hypothetical protein